MKVHDKKLSDKSCQYNVDPVSDQLYKKMVSVLKPGEKAAILIHPDPDSLASAWALSLILKKHKCQSDILLHEPIKRMENRTMVKMLRIPNKSLKEVNLKKYDLHCLVDAQPDQFPDISLDSWGIVIDHHPVKQKYPGKFSDLRPKMGANSSMMLEYLCAADIKINAKLATALCYGIMTDTDNFQRGMTKDDAEAFSSLFPQADYQLLKVIEQTEIPLKQLDCFELCINRLKIKSRRAIIYIGAADSSDIAVILADFFIRVSGIQFVAITCVYMEKLIIIFRSRNFHKDAGRIADIHFSDLGSAGGHKAAARAEIPIDRLPSEVKLYDHDSVEQFIMKRLSKPGKPTTGA
jgi:nanoRNase/pAp phosphatase (c-di-AMP/oligoRNAs hydrolase)